MRTWKMIQIVVGVLALGADVAKSDLLDNQIAKVREGEPIDPKEFKRGYDDAVAQYRTSRAQYYLSQVKWSLIDRETQGGWPFRSDLLIESADTIYSGLKKIVSDTGDPVARYAFVFPALYLQNEDQAEEQIAFLKQHDAFLFSRLNEVLPSARVGLANLKRSGEEVKKTRDNKDTAEPTQKVNTEPKLLAIKRWPVQILSAIYGTAGKDADVTGRVKEHVETFQRKFASNPKDLGADPNPGWNKSLRIVYMKDGVRREQRRNENEDILPESFYGPQDASELRSWLPESRWAGEQREIQFHADQTFTSAGRSDTGRWEALGPNKLRITWEENKSAEFVFDYTWSSFSEVENGKNVFHVLR